MALGDLLWASGFDNRDVGIFDLSAPLVSGYPTTNNRTTVSTAHLNSSATCMATLAAAGVKEFVVGLGFKRVSNGSTTDIFRLRSPNGVDNVTVGLDGAERVRVRRGTSTISGAVGTTALLYDVWYWLWLYTQIGDATGSEPTYGMIRVKLNNATEIATMTNQDTRNDAGTSGDTADRFTMGLSSNYHTDDAYVIDATGTTDYGTDCDPGEVTIPFLYPNAAGDTTALTTQGSGTNYLNVDEIPPNDATDYNYSGTPGTLDLYGLTNLSGATAVKGVVTRARHQKSASGALSARHILKSGSVSNGSDIPLSTSWVSTMRCMRKNPVTVADWTTGEVDALQVGFEVRT